MRPAWLGLAIALTLAASGAAAPAGDRGGAARTVAVSYADLLDPDVIVRTGEQLRAAVRRTDRRAAVQPFVERFSFLLPHAVTMVFGPDADPQESLADRYPPGAAQPAWAAILRSGRLHVSTDGHGRVRVFAPGDDARAAYRSYYGVLRHPLGQLAAEKREPLDVEVFAYRNDFRTSELRLHLTPYRFRAARFPSDRSPVDLAELDRFFRQGGILEGAELAPGEGLVLYASPGGRQSLAGQAVGLADLAVAFRAVFHAGDNEAFVSLDPHRDPTRATVNFGGLLEDTRVGQVVLTADERFKTVCSGLDPEGYRDVRAATRRAVPSFLTNTERAFLSRRSPASGGWVSTRYWYYPGSCGVEADPGGRLAAVIRPRFSADAERFGVEYLRASAGTKKAALPPEVRQNIRDLNTNYARYAAAFPEIRELSAVARLMAICAWLKRADSAWLDLDGLLAAELPAARTAREVPRLLTAEYFEAPTEGAVDADYVRRHTRVVPVNAELDRSVEQVFGTPEGLAAFLDLRAGEKKPKPEHAAEAQVLFEAQRKGEARGLLRTETDLRAFLRYVASRRARGGEEERESDAARLRRLQTRLTELAAAGGAGGGPEEERSIRAELREMMEKYHRGGGAGARVYTVVQHTGGISMEPKLFDVRQTAASPALERLRQAGRGKGGWVRSRPRKAGDPAPAAASRETARRVPAVRPKGPVKARAAAPAPPRPPPPSEEMTAPPVPPAPTLKKIVVSAGEGKALVGRLAADGRIVFTRAER